MSRGGSSGGGQSSLGYLFGSDDIEPPRTPPPPAPKPSPPYGVDSEEEATKSTLKINTNFTNKSNNYNIIQGQNVANFVTDRPTTKVNSVPGGDSSLGYLFGDK